MTPGTCEHCHGILDHAEVGRSLRREREAAGITAKAVAALMKISPQYLCDLEQGHRNWTRIMVLLYGEGLKYLKESHP